MSKLARMIANKYGNVVRMTEETGIPGSTIYSMIGGNGINTATVSNALKIAKVLGTTIEELAEPDKTYPKLTRYEKEHLTRLKDNGYEYLARDSNGAMFAYTSMPIPVYDYNEKAWVQVDSKYPPLQLLYCPDDFVFIRWTDAEAWSIQELLENCEAKK